MKSKSLSFVLFLLAGGNALAADGFEAVRCGGDIPGALIGKHLSNERVVVLEARHRDLALKDLGATEITDRINTISWNICGKEYVLLLDGDAIRDVLPFPAHSRRAPAFIGSCEIGGRMDDETVVAVLNNSAGYEKDYDLQDRKLYPATTAWKIDTKKIKFVKIDAAGVRCSRMGISTSDGGP